jgi:hypothetical protein
VTVSGNILFMGNAASIPARADVLSRLMNSGGAHQRARDPVYFSFDSIGQGAGRRRLASVRAGKIVGQSGDECETCGKHIVEGSQHAQKCKR